MKKNTLPIVQITILTIVLAAAILMFYLTQAKLLAVSRAQARVNDLTENQRKLEELKTSLPSFSGLAGSWRNILPANEKEVALFAGQIEQLAKTSNLTIALGLDDFPGPVDISGHYIAGLGVEVTLEGSFTGIINFLSGLNNLPYFFKIDKITLTKPETKVGVKAVINGALMMNLAI